MKVVKNIIDIDSPGDDAVGSDEVNSPTGIAIDFGKLREIMVWRKYNGETDEQVFIRNGKNVNHLPDTEIIDIVHAGGLQKWAETLRVKSQKELYNRIMLAIRKTISDPVFNNKKTIDAFPPLANFFYYCQRLDRNGRTNKEADSISELVWNTIICQRNLAERVEKMFSQKPDKAKFEAAAERIKEVWGMTDKDVDAIRYFVCQTRHERHNPSMNKSIYLWGSEKQTGKTTIARAVVTILNGDEFDNFGKYESTLSTEMQYNDHDVPAGALYNAVILDESMPKDASKSYGGIKQMLTSNSCKYNQKYGLIKRIPCKRFYFCTSNEDVIDFVQDMDERRFYAIRMTRKPKQLSFDEIYQIWSDFCINAEPESDWQAWYNSFEYVEGVAMRDMDEAMNEIILRKDEIFATGSKTYITAKQVANMIYKNEPNTTQKATVRSAMEKMFGECRVPSNMSNYRVIDCWNKATDLSSEMKASDSDAVALGVDGVDDNKIADDLPF